MILASQSPRRRELLGLITEDFEVVPAQGEERLPEGISPRDAVIAQWIVGGVCVFGCVIGFLCGRIAGGILPA